MSKALPFLEHLLFKGSEKLSARQVSEIFDAIGAESNASPPRRAPVGSDSSIRTWARVRRPLRMLQRPAFRQNEIGAERQVVIEEINMNDDPDDVAFENFTMAVFVDHPLEAPVLGTRVDTRHVPGRHTRLLEASLRGGVDGGGGSGFDRSRGGRGHGGRAFR